MVAAPGNNLRLKQGVLTDPSSAEGELASFPVLVWAKSSCVDAN